MKVLALIILLLLVGGCSGGGENGTSEEDDATDSETAAEELAGLINDYRVEQGLSSVPLSASLTAVAETHVSDLEDNNPDTGDCTLHSWSGSGAWSACCYTADDAEAECMFSKPTEISGGVYTSDGYEIAVRNTLSMTADLALESWQSSDPHHDVILNRDEWAAVEWKALGVALSTHYAVAWFGREVDPAGEP